MANKKISLQDEATTLDDDDVIPIGQLQGDGSFKPKKVKLITLKNYVNA